jgi:hypothetical protein
MWIRRQDKEMLIEAVCIYLGGENHTKWDYHRIYASTAEGDNWYIGKYSTKEKALKVLDMIQKLIYDYQLGGVFQMPSDDEVEE